MKYINKGIVFIFLAYHLLIPIYYIYFGEADLRELSKTGPRFTVLGGLTLNTLILLILVGNTFLASRERYVITKRNHAQIFRILILYIGLILFVTIIQFVGMELSTGLLIRKPLGFFSFPFLILNILLYFDLRDSDKFLKFIVYSGLFIILIFTVFTVREYFMDFNGINYANRLGGLVHYSSNGTAAFLAMLIPLFFYNYYRNRKRGNLIPMIFWTGIITYLTILIFLTFTRTVMIGILFSIILYYLLTKRTVSQTFMFIVFIILFIVFYSSITDLILRGQKDVFESLEEGEENTLGSRIFLYWLPSFKYLFHHPEQLLFGTPYRGFNEFLFDISGINRANHNSFVQHITTTGIFVTIVWFIFWYRILVNTYRKLRIRRKYLHNRYSFELRTALFFTLFIYFLSFNFMNINDEFFSNLVSIVVCLLIWNEPIPESIGQEKINLHY